MKYNLIEFTQIKKTLKPNTETTIISNSMYPWIRAGETIYISPCKVEELNKTDIIIYWCSIREILICHIFQELRDGKMITKALLVEEEDSPFNPKFLLGKVIKPQFRWYHKILLRNFS